MVRKKRNTKVAFAKVASDTVCPTKARFWFLARFDEQSSKSVENGMLLRQKVLLTPCSLHGLFSTEVLRYRENLPQNI